MGYELRILYLCKYSSLAMQVLRETSYKLRDSFVPLLDM